VCLSWVGRENFLLLPGVQYRCDKIWYVEAQQQNRCTGNVGDLIETFFYQSLFAVKLEFNVVEHRHIVGRGLSLHLQGEVFELGSDALEARG
jgi:hypothetical protein